MAEPENPTVEEQAPGEEPAPRSAGPTVVGIGASAGGLAALREFFAHVPEQSGLSWVVVVHLSPEHESHLADLLQQHVHMPVLQVRETVALEPDRVYVIPPGSNLSAVDTHLRLSKLEASRYGRAPIDYFFRTLASTHDGHSVGVILSGTGSDGALGIKAIKEKGGFVVVQEPGEAEFDGMPQSAISTGLVDLVLPLARIPEAILRFARTEPQVAVPEDGEEPEAEQRRLMQHILAQVRTRTGRDFGRYKPSTVLRRIQRRMQLRQIAEPEAYLEALRANGDEARVLADDLLITVTNFFRDPDVWRRLEAEIVPRLFEKKGHGDSVRIWTVGCATGEEAYSLAMLLLEEAGRHDDPPEVQIFASDLHDRSLARARDAFYPGDIEVDVSAERLRRFFHQENGGYRVRKEVRERVVFAPHNLLGDPPFSRLDLVTCRNVMIYLQRDAQQDVLEVFHYALRPRGYLLLGTSETVEGSELFYVEDKKLCVFRRRNVRPAEPRLPVFAASRALSAGLPEGAPERPVGAFAYGALHRRLLEQQAPPSILVGPDQQVVHLSAGAGRYLVHPGGEPTSSVFKLVREELRLELRSALLAARVQGERTRTRPVRVRFNGEVGRVVLDVLPAREAETAGFALVVFEERTEHGSEAAEPQAGPAAEDPDERAEGGRLQDLEAELGLAKQRLQAVIEEYERSQEEMQASHEELQSTNEELRSTMEELETSKEELQSTNEELHTVNQENRHKVEELSQLSSDLQNFLAASEIATLFLDRELRILRFTPKLGELFSVRPADRGRPISDLTHRLGNADLREDAEQVLRTLVPVQREVGDEQGRWYLTRVLPYRSTQDRIEGVVITFVEITARRRAEEALRESEEKYRSLFNEMDEAYAVVEVIADEEGRWADFLFHDANPAFIEHTGMEHPVGRTATALLGTPDPRWAEICGRVAETGEPLRVEMAEPTLDRVFDLNLFRMGGPGSRRVAVLFTDITERKAAEEEVRQAKVFAESVIETLHEPLLILHPDLRVRAANPAFYEHFGVRPEETQGRLVYALGNGQWNIPALRALLEDVLPENNVFNDYEVSHDFDDIGKRVMLLNARRLDHVQLILLGIRDITEKMRAEEALRSRAEHFRLIVEGARDYAILTTDPEGRIESWSPGAETVFGWSAEEAIGQDVAITFTPEDRASDVPAQELATAREQGSAPDVRWHLRSDRSVVFIEGITRLLKDGEGTVRGFVKIGQDVTARRRMEEALRESEERFRTLVQNIRDYAIFMLNPEGVITEWTEGAERVKGYTAREAIGQHVSIFFPPEEIEAGQPARELAEAAETGRAETEGWRLRKNGERFWVNAIATAIRDADGAVVGFTKISRDLTQWKRAELALRDLNQTLERRVEERTAELRVEIEERRRVEAVRNEVLRQLVTAEEDERQRIARELHDSMAQLMTALLLGLKTLEMDVEDRDVRKRLSELEELADRIGREMQHLALELRPPALTNLGLGLALRSHLEDWSERQKIEADFHAKGLDGGRLPHEVEIALYRIVQEGLTNVLRHAGATRVSLLLEHRPGWVRAILEDDGRGFDIEKTLASPEKAKRLGLRGMRERVALLGGELQIESSPGNGTTLFVRVPDRTDGEPARPPEDGV